MHAPLHFKMIMQVRPPANHLTKFSTDGGRECIMSGGEIKPYP